ncbi:type VII toxin-antitoxin system MntA family adenylyltransferase antitoxin [Desulfurobacterium crinifex]
MIKSGNGRRGKLERIEELKDFLKEFFLKKNKKVKVFLFGSRARGTHTEHSDVDIAIFSNEDITWEIVELKDILESSLLPQKVDIVDFEKAPESLKKEILKEGKLWIDLTK